MNHDDIVDAWRVFNLPPSDWVPVSHYETVILKDRSTGQWITSENKRTEQMKHDYEKSVIRYASEEEQREAYNLGIKYTLMEAMDYPAFGNSYGRTSDSPEHGRPIENWADIRHRYLDDSPAEPEPEPQIIWSDERTKRVNYVEDYLLQQIRTRYAMFERPSNRLQNVVIDSFAPKMLYMTKLQPRGIQIVANSLPKKAVAISPWFSKLFGVPMIPTEQLCRILGYSVADLTALTNAVKALKYEPTFVGYGGTGVNSIHWLTEICKLTKTINLFDSLRVYEPDNIEISNLLRFPKDPVATPNIAAPNTNKLTLMTESEIKTLSRDTRLYANRHSVYGGHPSEKQFFYGAPGLEYRHTLSEYGHFISATHLGNTCSLYLNPTQDTDLQVESYGLIQLAPFFMNQLRLAIGLLEFLSTDPDLSIKDTELMHAEFDGSSQLSTDRNYHFQMGHSGLVATQEEAANAV